MPEDCSSGILTSDGKLKIYSVFIKWITRKYESEIYGKML